MIPLARRASAFYQRIKRWKWLTPAGLGCNLVGAVLVAVADGAFIAVVKKWVLSVDPSQGLSFPTLHEGASLVARHSGVISGFGWSILCLGFAMQLLAWRDARSPASGSTPVERTGQMTAEQIDNAVADLMALTFKDVPAKLVLELRQTDSLVLQTFVAKLGSSGTTGAQQTAIREATRAILEERMSTNLKEALEKQTTSSDTLGRRILRLNFWLLVATVAILALTGALVWIAL